VISCRRVRYVDRLGRLTIPPEVRLAWNLRNGDPIGFTVEGDAIVAQRVSPRCMFCNGLEGTIYYRDWWICANCTHELGQILCRVATTE